MKSLVLLVCMPIRLHKNVIVVALTLTGKRGVRFRIAAFALAACRVRNFAAQVMNRSFYVHLKLKIGNILYKYLDTGVQL